MATQIPVYDSQFNQPDDIYSKDFYAIDVSNTIGDWVNAFNKNALASTDHKWYLNEMLFNGILYTGLETIGGVVISSLTNLSISSAAIQNLELDNFYLYFRSLGQVKLLDQVTFDLSDYDDGEPHFFYINASLGYRVSQQLDQAVDEIMLFRFIIKDGVFTQCYVTAQRFGSNVYDSGDEYYLVQGCMPLANSALTIKLSDGTIKRSGIKFDYHQLPDVVHIIDENIPMPLRYITPSNTVDFSQATVTNVEPNKYLNYSTESLANVPTNKFTAQRILFDIYSNCLIMQYGNNVYDTMQDALTSLNNVDYPFPYESLMFIPLGLMFIKQGATDLTDPSQCILVQHLNTTINPADSAFFAEDSYARGQLNAINNAIDILQQAVSQLQSDLSSHTTNYNNPHHVTKAQVGLGNVDNYSYTEIKNKISNDLNGHWLRKDANDTTAYQLTMGGMNCTAQYIIVNGQRLYIGVLPGDAPNGSWGIYTS